MYAPSNSKRNWAPQTAPGCRCCCRCRHHASPSDTKWSGEADAQWARGHQGHFCSWGTGLSPPGDCWGEAGDGVAHGPHEGEAISKVSARPGDAPEWETNQFGSRMDPALLKVTTNYLIMTETNQAQLHCHIIVTWPYNCRGKLPLWRSCLAFRSRNSSTASPRRTTGLRQIICCIISTVVGQPKANEDPIMGFYQTILLKSINQWHGQACSAQLLLTSSQPGTHAVSSSFLFPILFILFQMLQISYTNNQGHSGGGHSLCCCPGTVHDVWMLD